MRPGDVEGPSEGESAPDKPYSTLWDTLKHFEEGDAMRKAREKLPIIFKYIKPYIAKFYEQAEKFRGLGLPVDNLEMVVGATASIVMLVVIFMFYAPWQVRLIIGAACAAVPMGMIPAILFISSGSLTAVQKAVKGTSLADTCMTLSVITMIAGVAALTMDWIPSDYAVASVVTGLMLAVASGFAHVKNHSTSTHQTYVIAALGILVLIGAWAFNENRANISMSAQCAKYKFEKESYDTCLELEKEKLRSELRNNIEYFTRKPIQWGDYIPELRPPGTSQVMPLVAFVLLLCASGLPKLGESLGLRIIKNAQKTAVMIKRNAPYHPPPHYDFTDCVSAIINHDFIALLTLVAVYVMFDIYAASSLALASVIAAGTALGTFSFFMTRTYEQLGEDPVVLIEQANLKSEGIPIVAGDLKDTQARLKMHKIIMVFIAVSCVLICVGGTPVPSSAILITPAAMLWLFSKPQHTPYVVVTLMGVALTSSVSVIAGAGLVGLQWYLKKHWNWATSSADDKSKFTEART